MRKRHWLACLVSIWLAVVGEQAKAQSPPALPNNVGNPDQTGMLPSPYSANYGTYPQSYPGPQGGYPPGAAAWPNISPYYGPPVDQTSNQNGLWFNRQIFGNRTFYFTAEALFSNTNHPNSLVGANGVNQVPNLNPGVIYPDNNQPFQETAAGTSTIGTPDRETTGATGGGNNGGGASTGDRQIFMPQSTGSITDRLNSAGARGTWGFWNADQSGFQASAFFISPTSSTLYIGDRRGFDPLLYNSATFLQTDMLTHLHAYAGITLQGADTDHNGLPGVVQPFDIYYRLQYETRVGGVNLDWFASPIFERDAITLRPMYGARYIQTREIFSFDGADSGLGYTIAVPGQNGNNNGGGAASTNGNLSPLALEASTTLNIMQSMLSAGVTSQMAGPEAGLRLDLGKNHFKVYTQTKFGLLANYSSRNLSGFNIGDAYYPKTGGTATDQYIMPSTALGARGDVTKTRFSHEDNTTNLSPMFEQGIFGRANVFQYVPVLKKSKILSGAEFQAGYTVILIGNMYRPSNIIDWQAYPVSPLLTDKRSSFMTQNWSFGVQWDY